MYPQPSLHSFLSCVPQGLGSLYACVPQHMSNRALENAGFAGSEAQGRGLLVPSAQHGSLGDLGLQADEKAPMMGAGQR